MNEGVSRVGRKLHEGARRSFRNVDGSLIIRAVADGAQNLVESGNERSRTSFTRQEDRLCCVCAPPVWCWLLLLTALLLLYSRVFALRVVTVLSLGGAALSSQ